MTIMIPSGKYHSFDDLPDWARIGIKQIRPNDAEQWIHKPVPALRGESFLSVINNGEEGEKRAREYIRDVMGKFF